MRNHLQYYLAHYAALAAGICAIIAKLDPNVLGPNGAALVGAAVAGIAVAHALGIKPINPLVGVSLVPATPAPAEVAKQGGRILPALLGVLCAISIGSVLLVSGCAALRSIAAGASNPTTAPLIASGVEIAVTTEITTVHSTPVDQADAAERYITIAQALEAIDTGDVVTLSQLEAVASAQIDALNIPAGDKLAGKNLMISIAGILLQQAQAGTAPNGATPLTPDMKVAVKTILDDVILAASTFGVHARAVVRADLAR